MNAPSQVALPGPLADNPALDRWLDFPAPGRVTVLTGRVEFGQGVLTAMAQLAADELDIDPLHIAVVGGDTALTANEGYTAGSWSMQAGGMALRQACADARALFVERAALILGCKPEEITISDGTFLRNGGPTGQDYWTLAAAIDLAVTATGAGKRKPVSALRNIGTSLPRLDLPGKVFGAPAFIHDMKMPGMAYARVVRQPNKGARIGTIDEAAIRRAAKGEIAFVRSGDFLAILGDNETAVDLAAAASLQHVTWQHVELPVASQQEASWLLQRPAIDKVIGEPEAADAQGRERFEATYTRGFLAHASISPSCGLALFKDGHLTVWTHCQGVFPLRGALARTLKLDAANITVHHVQGSGCYGHNGADDAAADAAIIATQKPGTPIRVRWGREEEFVYEPKTPSMVVKVRALVGADGKPSDWTAEIWSPTHNGRPGSGNNLLGAYALPEFPPDPPPHDVPEAGGGGGTRNATPLYDIAQTRIIHHLIPETPIRVSSFRGLGAMPNVFALECAIDELAARAGVDPLAYRLSIASNPRVRGVIEKVGAMAKWQANAPAGTGVGRGIAFAQYKNKAAYAAVVVELKVDEEIRLRHVWCAADAGLVVNPDGILNQIEGGIIQSASWVLKEQVRFDGEAQNSGVASFDWETYPVLKFSEVPPIDIELINTKDETPLGVGELTAGPAAAAIGNAVSHALGTRIRDLPLTRERIMATLLK
ncbi:MAG: molybdopterin cofactor-binding domain-containing protein [Pseudolabrys sp.]